MLSLVNPLQSTPWKMERNTMLTSTPSSMTAHVTHGTRGARKTVASSGARPDGSKDNLGSSDMLLCCLGTEGRCQGPWMLSLPCTLWNCSLLPWHGKKLPEVVDFFILSQSGCACHLLCLLSAAED